MINQFFIYKIAFVLELLVSEYLFLMHLTKRKLFYLRVIFISLALISLAAFSPLKPDTPILIIINFFSFLTFSVILQLFCYKEKIITILYFCLIAYSVQFIAYCLDNIFVSLSGIKDNVFGVYTEEALTQGGEDFSFTFASIISFFIYGVTYHFFYMIYQFNMKNNEEYKITSKTIIILSIIATFSNVIVNAFVVFNVKKVEELLFIEFYSVALSFFTVHILYTTLKRNKTEAELEMVKKMFKSSKDNYELSKKNIEMINIKVHDLKHQIHSIGVSNAISPKAIQEIEEIVSIYDSQIQTGNKALDIILTEKSLYCYKNRIKLSCIADGKLLSFLDEVELYSLFGNLIDNAAHATKKVTNEEKRYIGLSIQNNRGFVTINIHNFFNGIYKLDENGFPLTTRSDKENHGFGMKSIRYIVERHDGEINFDIHDDIFEVNIIFPLK